MLDIPFYLQVLFVLIAAPAIAGAILAFALRPKE